MSLILDALNRSRTESEPVPSLASEPLFLPEKESRWIARLPWLALLLALLLIGWLAWDRLFSSSAASVDAAQPVSNAAQSSAPLPPANESLRSGDATPSKKNGKPVSVNSAAAAKAKARNEPGNSVAANAPAVAKAVVSRAAVPASAGAKQAAKAPAKEIERLYAAPRVSPEANTKPAASKKAVAKKALQPASKTKPVSVNSEADIAKIVQLAERERRSSELEEHDAPMVAALSQPKKDAIPTLIYERHDFNGGAPGRSSVVINGKTLRKGGTAARGVKVDEILSDSVVLKHQGTQFRLRALNSWVNL